MHALGDVDRLEIGREGAHQGGRVSRIEASQLGCHLTGIGVRFASRDRRHANTFDLFEEAIALLLSKDFTDQ